MKIHSLVGFNPIQRGIKGEYEDFTDRTLLFREFQFQLVPLIPFLAYAQTILVRSCIFTYFTRVENQPLKQRLKLERRIILKKLTTI